MDVCDWRLNEVVIKLLATHRAVRQRPSGDELTCLVQFDSFIDVDSFVSRYKKNHK